MPASLWTSTFHAFTFTTAALNSGSDITATAGAVIFTVEMYLSADDELDPETDIKAVSITTPGTTAAYPGFTSSLKRGDITPAFTLIGDLHMLYLLLFTGKPVFKSVQVC